MPDHAYVGMRDIASNQCRWIEIPIKKNPLCCGGVTHKHSSWCVEHYHKVFRQEVYKPKAGGGATVKYIDSPGKKSPRFA